MAVSKTAGCEFDSLRPCHFEEVFMVNPAEFVTQVKREFQRVTWPDKTETLGMSVAVVIFTVLCMLYFFASDVIINYILHDVLGL